MLYFYHTKLILPLFHPKLIYMEIFYNEVVKGYKKFERKHAVHPEVYIILLIAILGLVGTFYLFRYDTNWIAQISTI